MTNKSIVVILFSISIWTNLYAQKQYYFHKPPPSLKSIVITIDTVYEHKIVPDTGAVKQIEPKDALNIYINYDSSKATTNKTLETIESYNYNIPESYRIEFYSGTNIMESKKNFYKGENEGTWFYWNEYGQLAKTEEWHEGKLVRTIKYRVKRNKNIVHYTNP